MWWIIAWIACGIFVWGWQFAWWTSVFPEFKKRGYLLVSIFMGMGGPIAIIGTLMAFSLISAFDDEKIWYGWRLW